KRRDFWGLRTRRTASAASSRIPDQHDVTRSLAPAQEEARAIARPREIDNLPRVEARQRVRRAALERLLPDIGNAVAAEDVVEALAIAGQARRTNGVRGTGQIDHPSRSTAVDRHHCESHRRLRRQLLVRVDDSGFIIGNGEASNDTVAERLYDR